MTNLPTLTNLHRSFRDIKTQKNEYLTKLGSPHVESFNDMLTGIKEGVKNIPALKFQLPSGDKISLKFGGISISNPTIPLDTINVRNRNIYPIECRQRNQTYKGGCIINVEWTVNGITKNSIDFDIGDIPIMVQSKLCNLKGLSPKELVEKGEHEDEWGGYFIIKGHEKLSRMLIMTRRNYPISVKRNSWKDKGRFFSEYGIQIRSVRYDQISVDNVLHYLTNGVAKLMMAHHKFITYIPIFLILRALVDYTDEKIYEILIKGLEYEQYYISCVLNMMQKIHKEDIHNQNDAKNYLGKLFRPKFLNIGTWEKNSEVTNFILNEKILIHLDTYEDKFYLLVHMLQKLFLLVREHIKPENVDAVMMQEILLSGHLYQKFFIDRLEIWLNNLKYAILKKTTDSLDSTQISKCCKLAGKPSTIITTFLATGNAPTKSGIGIMQSTGLVIVAENINRMRYMSHFRAVHRGSFFTTMRTTEARQLLPDAWGFICPVHTPDGAPCGLLNHLTVSCEISKFPDNKKINKIHEILINLGMIPINMIFNMNISKMYIVVLEGKILGYIRKNDSLKIVNKLRHSKVKNELPKMMEIVLIQKNDNKQFPGLFIFIGPARMMRPVFNLELKQIEYIGSFEQVYMEICVDKTEMYPGITTHMEITKTDFLSNLANLIPLPDFNQSPRNMYQCQMGKQTMGTPCHNFYQQTTNKIYRLQTPATPLFRPVHHDNLNLDDFAMGKNAIVAVISYTGYDMEDAMIINKSAHERGFAAGCMYKSKFIELEGTNYFSRDPNNKNLEEFLDIDGLPYVGIRVFDKSPICCYFDNDDSTYKIITNEEKEISYIDGVKLCGDFKIKSQSAYITIRIQRNPTIGDKFASRAGQKGIFSKEYPAEDLPFTETGLIPDIVFNPHGFPSRMTIAMMIETMAGKSAAIHGLVHDATPFRFSEKHTAIDYFGKLLEAGGYNYFGTEKMYSGINGKEMQADIFFGIVHYQRLRHMVFDKWQVRSTGPIDAITHQPIKGRRHGGGVRFGEMERDSLISHGASFLLQDRLFINSDKTIVLVCSKCGSLLSAQGEIIQKTNRGLNTQAAKCRLCNDETHIKYCEIPYAFKYLVSELGSLNIHVNFKFDFI